MANDFSGSSAILPLFEWLTRLGVITQDEQLNFQSRKPHAFFDPLRSGYLLSKIAMVAVPANAHYFRNDVCHDAATSIERQQNIKIFLSACKELKAKTNLKNEVIERLSVNEWLEMCQTLQSLSKKVSSQLKDTSGNFDPFTLNGNDVKKMIDVAKVPSSDNPEDQPQDYNPYESPYGDPSDDARRVSQVLSMSNSGMYDEYIIKDEDEGPRMDGLRGPLNELCNNELKYKERFIRILNKLATYKIEETIQDPDDPEKKKTLPPRDPNPAVKNILLQLSDHAYFVDKLHDELFERIKPPADVYINADENQSGPIDDTKENVADVFVKMKSQFLIYAPFIVHCANAGKTIELMHFDDSVKKDIKHLEDFLQEEIKFNQTIPPNFNSLLAFPMQHVIRFKLMMNTIGKELSKKIKTDIAKMKRKKVRIKKESQLLKDKRFLQSCQDAVNALHELNIYINSYKRDSDYKAKVRKICDQMRNMTTTDGIESNYGQLMFEIPKMKFKKETDTKYEENCFLLCFQSRILIFDIEAPEDEAKSWEIWKKEASYQINKESYVYIGSIKVTNSMALLADETAGTKKEGLITVRNNDDFKINYQESFNVMVPLGELDEKSGKYKEFDALKMQFEKLINEAMRRPDTDKHRMHDYHTAIQKHDIEIKNPKPPPVCGECGLYIFGLLFMGYKCETCNECYHKECFLNGEATGNIDEDTERINYIAHIPNLADISEEEESDDEPDESEEETYVIGTEAELTSLKINGGAGDFIIYSKEDDRNFPMRIAFLKSGGKQSVVQKLKILRNTRGQYSFQGKDKQWFYTMSKLIDESNNENSKRLKRPFLGFSSPPTSPEYEEEEIDKESEYVLDGEVHPIIPVPARRNIKEQKPRPVTPTDPEINPYEVETDELDKIASNSTPTNDLIGEKAPTDVKILYNRQNVKSLLKNRPAGDFLIHQGDKNNKENPYTVYANKENKEGAIKLAPAYIYYDEESENFSVGKKGKAYTMLGDLLNANKKTLLNQIDV